MRSGDVDGPPKAGAHPEHALIPADAFNAEQRQRLAAAERHVGFQPERVDQLRLPALDHAAEQVFTARFEFEEADQVRRFRPHEAVRGRARRQFQVLEVVVEDVVALGVEVHQPAADGAVRVGHDVDGGALAGGGRSTEKQQREEGG